MAYFNRWSEECPIVVTEQPITRSLNLRYDYGPAIPHHEVVIEDCVQETAPVCSQVLDGSVVRTRAVDEYYVAPDVSTAAKLDAADGVMDGKYFGKDIFTTEGAQVVVGAAPSSHTYITTHSAPYVVRETVPSPAYVVNNTADAIRLDAADGHLDGSHRGTPIYLGEEEDLAAENARLRNLISELSDTFKNRFEELSAKRDGDYLDLLARFNDANKPSSAVGKKAEKAAAPKPSTASKLIPSSKPLAAVKLGPNQILVHVQEATGLQMQDGARPCVQLQMSGVVRGTAYHEPSKHPVWRETLVIPEKAGIAGRRMIVTVKTQFGEVGRATLELPSHAVQTDVWVPISKAGKTTGNVHLGIEAAENVTIPQQVAKPRHLSRSPPRHPKAKAPVPPPAATLVTDTDAEGAIPSLLRPQVWDLTKMDGEKFWVCLVAKDGHLVLDPAEYKKAPHLWTLSQASSEAIFHAYNSSFQTAMRRKGLNKLNSYYQREINDMKGIYLSHLDEQVGGPKAVSLRLKEEQILALEQKLREAEASRDDLAAKLVESANLLTEKTHQIQAMNKAMREEVEDISETRQYLEERRRLDDAEFLRVMHGDRNLSAQTEARLYQMDHFDPQELNPEELLAEVNALRAALQEQQYETTTLRERLEAVGNNEAVRAKVMSSPARSSPPRPSPSRHI